MQNKQDFINHTMFQQLEQLQQSTLPAWGKMNAQQMVEHLGDFFLVSSGKLYYPLLTPVEQLPKYREFLYSDKLFRENTKAPAEIVGEEPAAVKTNSLKEATSFLQAAVSDFNKHFRDNPTATTIHPVFGPLTFQEWILLHYKHASHHLRQFGLQC